MNIFDGSGKGAARIRYLDANFEVVTPGSYVVCAITGRHIPLEELRYWSVARQEAYVDAEASFEAEKRAGALPTDKA
ncbi:DUF2093 domain-containing protein [Martelella mediterranea]|uniref:DUF2093 domain-containing protein n=1 Tax=Martelella mediterranea DSM 17316 TaxID=1122214 RepID=A0A1U9YY42_9HYPH|nr:DUF2093 domain-containing protein [Martelella mediterranea]AQZ50351.1 hypothetical protein Mame_00977 [Martelella mediterranea DSM 17316]